MKPGSKEKELSLENIILEGASPCRRHNRHFIPTARYLQAFTYNLVESLIKYNAMYFTHRV
jgi:hypothetical protein